MLHLRHEVGEVGAAAQDLEATAWAEQQRIKVAAQERVDRMKREAAERRRLADEAEDGGVREGTTPSSRATRSDRKTSLSGPSLQLTGAL